MAHFSLDLLTPSGTVVQGLECDDITVMTSRGEINILPDHTHLLTELGTGTLVARLPGGEKRYFTLTAGLCKVLKNQVSIMSITSEKAEDIDQQRAEKAKKVAQEKLAGKFDSLTDIELVKFQRKLERAEARLRTAYIKNN